MVGVGTVLADDPGADLPACPATGRPAGARRGRQPSAHPAHARRWSRRRARRRPGSLIREGADRERRRAFADLGVRLIEVAGRRNRRRSRRGAGCARRAGITRVLVEGGASSPPSLLRADLVDRIAWFHAPAVMGGGRLAGRAGVRRRSASAPCRASSAWPSRPVGDDMLTEFAQRAGPLNVHRHRHRARHRPGDQPLGERHGHAARDRRLAGFLAAGHGARRDRRLDRLLRLLPDRGRARRRTGSPSTPRPRPCRKTTLGRWQAAAAVNLERSLRVGDELGGHIVSGHVDGVGEVALGHTGKRLDRAGASACPAGSPASSPPKGSVAVDGVSLTVNEVDGRHLRREHHPAYRRGHHASARLRPGDRGEYRDRHAGALRRPAGGIRDDAAESH